MTAVDPAAVATSPVGTDGGVTSLPPPEADVTSEQIIAERPFDVALRVTAVLYNALPLLVTVRVATPCMGLSAVAWHMSATSLKLFVQPEAVLTPVEERLPIDAKSIRVPVVGTISGVVYVVSKAVALADADASYAALVTSPSHQVP